MVTTRSHTTSNVIVVGVDTHADTHHAAILDLNGAILADAAFPTTTTGYQALADWAAGYGLIDRIGIELTGSYGAGLTRHLTAAGIDTREVNTSDKATRARHGKDDRSDAIAAARKVLAGMATATPKDTTGTIESIRILTLVRDTAVTDRTRALNQLKDLRVTAPAALREHLHGLTLPALARRAAAFRTDPARLAEPEHATKHAMKRLGIRIKALTEEITTADNELAALVADTAPTLLNRPGIGTHTAARLLISAAANIDRLTTDAAFARLCGAAPIPVSSGKTHRMRLHRGGDRQANRALHMIIIGRLRTHPETRAYMQRRLTEGLSKRDIIRALKRFLARRIYNDLKTDLNPT